MRYLVFALALLCTASSAEAQSTSTQEAQYVAITKAVVNYKINDDEISKDIDKLRQHKRFNEKLQKMLNKLTNGRSKNSTNKKVLKVLEETGKELEKILD